MSVMISGARTDPKASEAAAEVRSDAQLQHVLFHQCKRVADWLRFKSSYMRLADWLRVESSDLPDYECYLNTLSLWQQKA